MKIAIACDHGGFELKAMLAEFLTKRGYDLVDMGCESSGSVDYVDYAKPVCEAVRQGTVQRGILICGTGVGMSIAANKFRGIRCALCGDTVTARLTREHNDSNVLALGGRIIGREVARAIALTWLETGYTREERHARRIEKIQKLED